MLSEDQTTDLVKTASMTLPPEIVASSENAEKQCTSVAGQQTENAAVGESGISSRRLVTIMIGLCLTIFLTALDQVIPLSIQNLSQTIVSTAVPTMVADLGDSSGYTWIGTSYLLARFIALYD